MMNLEPVAATLVYVFHQPIGLVAGITWSIGLFLIIIRSVVRMTQTKE